MKSIGLYVNPDRSGAIQSAINAAEILIDLGAECCVEPSIFPLFPVHLQETVQQFQAIDFERFAKVAKEIGAIFMVDMAHYAGLIAAGVYPNPVSPCLIS